MLSKKLEKFKDIISLRPFDYISDHKNINNISYLIKHSLNNPKADKQKCIDVIDIYLSNLKIFSQHFRSPVPSLLEGFDAVIQTLEKVKNILVQDDNKRSAISKRYCNKFEKTFLYGLSMILKGIRASFDPYAGSFTIWSKDQIINFIKNPSEGLGDKYEFNSVGRYSFDNNIKNLNKQELLSAIKLLKDLPQNHVRKFNGWLDLGSKKTPVRILIKHNHLFKDKVYFIYKLNEHDPYEHQLRISPENSIFRAA